MPLELLTVSCGILMVTYQSRPQLHVQVMVLEKATNIVPRSSGLMIGSIFRAMSPQSKQAHDGFPQMLEYVCQWGGRNGEKRLEAPSIVNRGRAKAEGGAGLGGGVRQARELPV